MRIVVFLCLILCTANNIFAASISSRIVSPLVLTGERHNNYNLATHMEMYIDKSHQLTVNDVTDPSFSSKFVPYDFAEQRSRKNYDQTVWLRFRITNSTVDDIHLFLTKNFPNQYTDWVAYKQTPHGPVKINSFADKTIHISLFPLDISENSTETYYLHNYSEGWLQTTFHLMKPSFYLLDQIDLFFVMGIQYGIALALVLHSLFIYLFLRDRSYLLYITFVFSGLLAFVLMDGLLNRLPGIVVSNWWYLHLYRFMLVEVGFVYILFAKNILQTKKYIPRTHFLMNIMLWLVLPATVMAWLPSFRNPLLAFISVLTITHYLSIALILSTVAAILVVFKGYKPAQYYLAGMIVMMVIELFYFISYFQAMLPAVIIFRLPQFGLDIDMILQAIALAVRFNLIQEEQIKTQREVIKQKDLNSKLQEHALHDKQRLIKGYARFFPRRFLQLLKKKSILDIHLGDQAEKNMTVLFADLRNFTTLLEKKSPSESFAFINGYLNQIAPIVRQHDGLIDKYIGDAILALYEGSA
ncbi:MAG: intracellular signaling protein, partial [uncultured bacterium]